jgi:hypothetical protein
MVLLVVRGVDEEGVGVVGSFSQAEFQMTDSGTGGCENVQVFFLVLTAVSIGMFIKDIVCMKEFVGFEVEAVVTKFVREGGRCWYAVRDKGNPSSGIFSSPVSHDA